MKLERISENQIRCTLTRSDLAERELKLSELAYGSEKAKALFREMMVQASDELGFEAENIPLIIEAVPISNECIMLIVTKVDEDNFIELAESYGLTTIIQPADVTAGRIVEYVRWMQNSAHSSGVETLRMVADGQAEALEFIVRAESQFLDVPLKALKLKDSVLVASIIRRGKCRVPSGNDAIELGDRVVVVTTNHGMHELKDILK